MTARARTALRGDLALLAPEIVVQMLALARLSGCLVLRRRRRSCRVYLRDGRLAFARVGRRVAPRRGVAPRSMETAASARERLCAALAVALPWREGSFTFEPGVTPEPGVASVNADPQEILLACLSHVPAPGGGDENARE